MKGAPRSAARGSADARPAADRARAGVPSSRRKTARLPSRPLPTALVLLLAALGCGECDAEAPPNLHFEAFPADLEVPAAARIDATAPSEARVQVLAATRRGEWPPTFVGANIWDGIVVVPEDAARRASLDAGRTYVRSGPGALRLDVRMGAGDRGAFMGGTLHAGAERAMLQIRVEDPQTLGARFQLRIHAVESDERPRDATPPYLERPVPRGIYRAWVDIPARGGRYLVEVWTVDREGTVLGRAWASPIAVERPWLAR
ncbi:MAG: hypothetical protein CMN29_30260 [Sandaracinus sp.]|nr:hypothetical protein [Sandaracinus sp.]HJL25920.1 hypothetical protein [Polyangiaceae bacterium LLY-WYZ-15_(1-7)]